MKKKFYVRQVDSGIVEVDIPDDATEGEIDFLVRDAIQLGCTEWHRVEVADFMEVE